MNQLSNSFYNREISDQSLDNLYTVLLNSSEDYKRRDAIKKVLKSLFKDIFINYYISEDIRKIYNNCTRILKYTSMTIFLNYSDFGLKSNTKLTLKYTNSVNGSDMLPKLPLINPDTKTPIYYSYWSGCKLLPEMIKERELLEKLKCFLIEYERVSYNLNHYLEEYKDNKGIFLKKLWKKPTYGLLYDYNRDWFNILIFLDGISEKELYEEVETSENIFEKLDNLENSIKALKLFLES